MKRSLFWLILAVTGAMLLLGGCGAKEQAAQETASEQQASQDFYAMDTVMNITAYGEKADEAVQECVQYINELEAAISRTQENSEISQLNDADGEAVELSEQTADILHDALEIAQKTEGKFDPTVASLSDLWQIGTEDAHLPEEKEIQDALEPVGYTKVTQDGTSVTMEPGTRIDLGGIGKGYAADHVVEILESYDVERAIISLGGNIYAYGSKGDGVDWKVAITDPDHEEDYLGTLSVSDTSIVTSGDYERYFEQDGKRYCHIFDSSTGYPAETDLRSVTIVSPDSTTADGYSTALFVMGCDKAIEFCEQNDIEAVLVRDDHTVFVTDGIKDRFELLSTEYQYEE
ncbi:MAG: FAD:protein FMN transferase [Eubacteriales bacterium]|nr:FAD:protein FMN transferase [Eubacteriales bacterium]